MRAGGPGKWYKYQAGDREELSSLLPPSAATAAVTAYPIHSASTKSLYILHTCMSFT
jgi:hypothetical protein